MMIEIPKFQNKSERLKWLVANKSTLIDQKKHSIKHGEVISYPTNLVPFQNADKSDVTKMEVIHDTIKVKSIINTTMIMDSHSDVHINGLWTKSLQETKRLYLLQEHDMSFKGIISDDVTAYSDLVEWKSLGFDFEGKTEALTFISNINEKRNNFMFNQYKDGYVHNHSVGMQYVKIYLAVNDSEEPEEFEVWNKFIESIVNKEQVKEQGYFFAVTEAKVREGSAVPIGSNFATPTMSVEQVKDIEPSNDTQNKDVPSVDTHEENNFINLNLF